MELEMCANAQRDGRPAEYRWRSLFNAAKFCWLPLLRVPCSNAAKTRNPFKFTGVPQTRQQNSAISRPKFTILWGHAGEVLLVNKFFPIVDTCLSSEDIAGQTCAMMCSWTRSEFCTWQNSVRGQELLKMYIQHIPGKDTAEHSANLLWSTSVERRRCSNEAKTRKPLAEVQNILRTYGGHIAI